MLTGYVIYKGKQPLVFDAGEELRYRLNKSSLIVGFIFFDLGEAEAAMAEIPELLGFDNNVKLSIKEIKLPAR